MIGRLYVGSSFESLGFKSLALIGFVGMTVKREMDPTRFAQVSGDMRVQVGKEWYWR